MTNPLEKEIEKKLRTKVEALGGRCLKWTCPGWGGVPDRIVIMPGGLVTFVELKAPGGRLRAIQKWQHERIRKRGCEVRVIWNRMQVDEWMQERGGDAR